MSMKRGVKFKAVTMEPIHEMNGIPVRIDPEYQHTAEARGVWPLKTIVTGHAWQFLPPREQYAVLLHEAYHCRYAHKELRLLYVMLLFVPGLVLLPWAIFAAAVLTLLLHGGLEWLAYRQEFAADAAAVEAGYGIEMANIMQRNANQLHDTKYDPFHPSAIERFLRLQKLIREMNHGRP